MCIQMFVAGGAVHQKYLEGGEENKPSPNNAEEATNPKGCTRERVVFENKEAPRQKDAKRNGQKIRRMKEQ